MQQPPRKLPQQRPLLGRHHCTLQFDMRVCQIGWAGQPWARNPKTPHFYWLGLGRPGPPQALTLSMGLGWPGLCNPSLLSAGPWPAQPIQIPHFYRRGPASSTPHFYWPDPSLLSARPDPVTPAAVTPRPKNTPTEQPPPISPGLAPSLFGKPSYIAHRIPK